MTPRQAANVAFKTLGIYWLFRAVEHLIRVILLPFADTKSFVGIVDYRLEIVNVALVFAVYLIGGAALVFGTQRVMDFLRIRDDGDAAGPNARQAEVLPLAFAAVGLYYAVPAIAGLIPTLFRLWILRHSGDAALRAAYFANSTEWIATSVIELLLGCGLIIGHQRLYRFWRDSRPMARGDSDAT